MGSSLILLVTNKMNNSTTPTTSQILSAMHWIANSKNDITAPLNLDNCPIVVSESFKNGYPTVPLDSLVMCPLCKMPTFLSAWKCSGDIVWHSRSLMDCSGAYKSKIKEEVKELKEK